VLGTSVAAAAFWPTYRTSAFVVMAAVTIAAGAAIATLGAVCRWSTAVVSLVTCAVFLLFGVPVAVPSQAVAGVLPSVRGLIDLVGAVALGWKQLLTISVPVGSYEALLVPAYLLILLTAVTAVTIALRASRREFAALAPLSAFVVAVVLGPNAVDAAVPLALALVVLLAGWLMLVRADRTAAALRELSGEPAAIVSRAPARLVRGGLLTIGVLFVAAAIGGAAAVALPAAVPRQVARTAMQPPFDPRDYPSPLSAFRSYLEPQTASEPMITVSGLGEERRVSIATLDDYNGVVYAVSPEGSGSFARTPATIQQNGAGGRHVSLDVTVDGYSGVWVPDAGLLGRLQFTGARGAALNDRFFYNDATGTGAVLGGLTSGDEYRLNAVTRPEDSIASLKGARPGSASEPRVSVMPSGVRDAIERYASAGQHRVTPWPPPSADWWPTDTSATASVQASPRRGRATGPTGSRSCSPRFR
jgi:Predicted membrane-bound mannosyltransferase